ncbi:MAG: nucleotide exchange factor GrpE [Brevinematales bacterium]|nr:nucleotide exchange factor GrpE [Brevinematales bacterium]
MKGEKHHSCEEKKIEKNEEIQIEEVEKLKEENNKLKQEIEELKCKVSELDDAYRRKVADFDNYRKRMLKQLEESETEGIKKIAKELLPIVDNFEKALNTSAENKDFDSLFNGLKIIYSLMGEVFGKFNIKPFESKGVEFDHNLHEAVMMEERDDVEFNQTVIEEYEKGYLLGDNVLRHAKVKVAKKKNN